MTHTFRSLTRLSLATFVTAAVSACGALSPAGAQETHPEINPDAWVVTVDARAEGHLSPVWYTAGQFQTKALCEAFRASPQWKDFYLAWAKEEITLHQGKIDFGPAPYCTQVKLIKNYINPAPPRDL